MKKIIVIAAAMVLLCFMLAGCSGKVQPAVTESPSHAKTPEPEPVSSAPEDNAAEIENAIERYCELYNADHVYRDVAVPQKAMLIGEEQIVELTYFSGYENTKVIERSSLVRVENSRLAMFDIVNIYDKTNQCISVMVEPGLSDEIAALLK